MENPDRDPRKPPNPALTRNMDASRQIPLPHVVERVVVHGAILLSRAGTLEEVEAALRAGRPEVHEEIVADRRAIAVLGLVAGAGVVDVDPRRGLQAGPQHLLLLPGDAPGVRVQEAPDLALGDVQADHVEHFRDPSRRRLALAARHDGQGLDAGAELLAPRRRPRRQRRHVPGAVGKLPHLAAVGDLLGMEHDVADRVVLVALVHRALGHVPEAHGLLAAAQVRVPPPRAAALPLPLFLLRPAGPGGARRRAVRVRVRRAGAVRLQVRTARELLQPPDLVLELPDPLGLLGEPPVLLGKPCVPIGKLAGKVVELRVPLGEQGPDGRELRPERCKAGNRAATCFRVIHAHLESQNDSRGNPPNPAAIPGKLPLLLPIHVSY